MIMCFDPLNLDDGPNKFYMLGPTSSTNLIPGWPCCSSLWKPWMAPGWWSNRVFPCSGSIRGSWMCLAIWEKHGFNEMRLYFGCFWTHELHSPWNIGLTISIGSWEWNQSQLHIACLHLISCDTLGKIPWEHAYFQSFSGESGINVAQNFMIKHFVLFLDHLELCLQLVWTCTIWTGMLGPIPCINSFRAFFSKGSHFVRLCWLQKL